MFPNKDLKQILYFWLFLQTKTIGQVFGTLGVKGVKAGNKMYNTSVTKGKIANILDIF